MRISDWSSDVCSSDLGSRFMSKSKIEGSFVATVTPFDRQGAIDFGAWRTLIDHQHRHGTRAILFLGSTGEPTLLPPEEKKQVIVETGNQNGRARGREGECKYV